MDKQKYIEIIKQLYIDLEQRADAGEVGDAWGDDLLLEFYDFLVGELYPVQGEEPEWAFVFEQLYNWQFQSFHEGIDTFYTNLYQVDTNNGIRRMSDCLYQYGYMELAKWYDYGIFDYNLYPDDDYPAEYGLRMAEIDEWIHENTDIIWQIYVELLLGHKEELLEAAANWQSKCETQIEEQKEKEDSLEPKVQKKKALTFQPFINLKTSGSTTDEAISWLGGDISSLTASHIDDMVSQMVAAKELRRIQTTEAFSKEALRLLDEKLFSVREDIVFRIYSLQNGDLQHFAEMVHIRKLCLDCMDDMEHVEVLSKFTYLTELVIDLPKRYDFRFVNELSQGLTQLSLYVDFLLDNVTFENDRKGSTEVALQEDNSSEDMSLYEMEWLLRFPKLENFYIGNSRRHIEFLIRKDGVREFSLYNMPCPSLAVLQMLEIQSVIVHQEHAQGLERFGEIDSLQEMELVKIADLDNLDFLEGLSALKKITLRSLPELSSVPQFPEGQKLQEVVVYDCDKLLARSMASEKIFVRNY